MILCVSASILSEIGSIYAEALRTGLLMFTLIMTKWVPLIL